MRWATINCSNWRGFSMWANEAEMIDRLAERIAKLLRPQEERRSYAPLREPKPPEPPPHSLYPAGSQDWFVRLAEPPTWKKPSQAVVPSACAGWVSRPRLSSLAYPAALASSA